MRPVIFRSAFARRCTIATHRHPCETPTTFTGSPPPTFAPYSTPQRSPGVTLSAELPLTRAAAERHLARAITRGRPILTGNADGPSHRPRPLHRDACAARRHVGRFAGLDPEQALERPARCRRRPAIHGRHRLRISGRSPRRTRRGGRRRPAVPHRRRHRPPPRSVGIDGEPPRPQRTLTGHRAQLVPASRLARLRAPIRRPTLHPSPSCYTGGRRMRNWPWPEEALAAAGRPDRQQPAISACECPTLVSWLVRRPFGILVCSGFRAIGIVESRACR